MSYDCDPCNCVEMYYRDIYSFRKAVITLLCDIITAAGEGCPECPECPEGDSFWLRSAGGVITPAIASDSLELEGDITFTANDSGVIEALDNYVAAGNDLATATPITARTAVVTGADSVKGVRLPINPIPGTIFRVVNRSSTDSLFIYPGQMTDVLSNAAGPGLPCEAYEEYTMTLMAITATRWQMISWY